MIVARTTSTQTVIRRPRLSGGASAGCDGGAAAGVGVGSVIRAYLHLFVAFVPIMLGMDGDEQDLGENRLAARIGRFALGPARAAARSGKSALAGEAERAVDGALAGPLPEAVARAIVDHRVLERALAETLDAAAERPVTAAEREQVQELVDRLVEHVLASPALERFAAGLIESRLAEDLADRVVKSEAFRRALQDVLTSPEVRRALTRQTAGFGGEIAAAIRERTGGFDDSLEAKVHHREPAPSRFGGLGTRGVGLVADLVLAQLAFLLGGALIGLVASLVGTLRPVWLVGTLVGAGWLIVVVAYFVGFWSTTGQTPGMRLMRLRVVTGAGVAPGLWRSAVRLVGLVLAIVPLFAGFVPVLFDGRRRALQDFLAGTVVVREPERVA